MMARVVNTVQHTGATFVDISKIFVAKDDSLFGTEPFVRFNHCFTYTYHIVPNKRSLCTDRHPGEFRGS